MLAHARSSSFLVVVLSILIVLSLPLTYIVLLKHFSNLRKMLSQRFPWPLLFIIFSILVILSFVALNHFTGLLLLPGSHHSVPPAPPPPATSPSVSHDPIHDFQNPAPSLTSSAVWSLSTSYPGASWSFETERDSLNLGLSDEQCDV